MAMKTFEIKDGVIRVNSGDPATSIKIVVDGKNTMRNNSLNTEKYYLLQPKVGEDTY